MARRYLTEEEMQQAQPIPNNQFSGSYEDVPSEKKRIYLTPDQEKNAILMERFKDKDFFNKQEPPKEADGNFKTGAFLSNLGDTLSFGMSDEAEGLLGAASRGASYLAGDSQDKGLLDSLKTGYTTSRDSARQLMKDYENQAGGYATAGKVAGVLSPLGFGAVRAANPILYGMGAGAAGGLGHSEGETVKEDLDNTLFGGVAGGAAGALFTKLPGAIANKSQDIKNWLALKAMGTSKGNLKKIGENADDVADVAMRAGVVNPFKLTGGKINALDEFKSATGNTIGKFRESQADAKIPLDTVKKNLDKYIDEGLLTSKLEVDAPKLRQVQSSLKDVNSLANKSGDISFNDLVKLKQKFGETSRKSFGEVNPSKDAVDKLRQGLRKTEMEAVNNPSYTAANKDYGNSKIVENLLKDLQSQSANNPLGILGTVGGVGTYGGTQDPSYTAAVAMLLSPTGRRALAAGGAQSIQLFQKIASINPIFARALQDKLARRGVHPE